VTARLALAVAAARCRRPAAGIRMAVAVAIGAAAGMGPTCAWAAEPVGLAAVSVQEPRAFGYSIGDVVSRVVTVEVPAGLELDEATLPAVSAPGRAIELRRLVHRSAWQAGGRRHELALDYQVFLSPPEVRTLELPPFTLRLVPAAAARAGAQRVQELRVDAWPVTVAPLTPIEARTREGLGELRPDRPPPQIDTSAARRRGLAYGVLALALLAYLAHVYVWTPWWAPRRRPFGVAWRALHRQRGAAPADQQREAFRRLHAALNQTAGRVVFEPDIGRFIAEHPRFAPLGGELATFFQRSREHFFAGAEAVAAAHGPWLLGLCRACRDAERGSA
jgi:mxaA protein